MANSFISPEQALVNLGETAGRAYAALRDEATTEWNAQLGKIRVDSDDFAAKETFYTCFYRTMLFPMAVWEMSAAGEVVHWSPATGKTEKGYYYAGSNNIDEVAWYDKNSDENIKPVAKKKANELGLFDMSGNVWEWCGTLVDHYTADAVTDPVATSGKAYALRGGGSHYDATGPRCGCRGWNVTNYFDSNLGFRLCLK